MTREWGYPRPPQFLAHLLGDPNGNVLKIEKQVAVISALVEGNSIRSNRSSEGVSGVRLGVRDGHGEQALPRSVGRAANYGRARCGARRDRGAAENRAGEAVNPDA